MRSLRQIGKFARPIDAPACIVWFSVFKLSTTRGRRLPPTVRLPEKDVPILLAAIESRSNWLLTGDRQHFGKYFGRKIGNVTILRPRDYLMHRSRM
jgi:hypothetical protein